MQPLYDMLTGAQNGQAMDALARQFNLSQQQAQAAVSALLPAFSQGLKHNASDPYGVGAFLGALSTGQHAKYFDETQAAFSPEGIAEGNGILAHLFGSKDLSRAVAAQAAQTTGIGQDILRRMLPVIASMIMGGLFKQTSGQLGDAGGRAASAGSSGNPLGDILAEMMKQGGAMMGGGRSQPETSSSGPMDNPLGKILEGMLGGALGGRSAPRRDAPAENPLGDNPFGKMFEEMLGGGRSRNEPEPEPEPRRRDNPTADNPFGKMFEEMLGGGRARREPEPEPEPRRRDNPSGRQRTPYDDLFGNMFETGAKQRDEVQKNMESIVGDFLKGMDRRR